LLSLVLFLTNKPKGFFVSVILNGISGWAGYFFYPWLFLLKKRRSWLVKAGIILVMVFCLHLLHTYFLTGSAAGGGLVEALKLRLNLNPTENFTWWSYLLLEKQRLVAFYTLSLLAVAALGTLWSRDKLMITLLGWGLSYPLIFSNVVFVHDYFNIFFIPWLAVASAWVFNRIGRGILPIVIIFLALVFGERNQFYQALQVTNMYEPGYRLGTEINRITPAEAAVYVVGSQEAIELQNLYISYYADRKITYLSHDDSLPDGVNYVFNLN
jgi:hypothetical protein